MSKNLKNDYVSTSARPRACLVCRRRQYLGLDTLEYEGVAETLFTPVDNTQPESLPADKETNPHGKNCEQVFLSTQISIDKLMDMTSENIADEFKRLSESTENKEAKDTSPYNMLKTTAVAKIYQDVFNACYVDGYRKTKAYITCAYQVFKQKELFWNMVWDEGCDRIVMLSDSNMDEETTQYWPKRGDFFKFGDLTVNCLSIEDTDDDFVERMIKVKKKTARNMKKKEEESEERTVLQHHFMGWLANFVPRSTNSLIEFQKYRNQITSDKVVPVVVHCSDGIGRTGTFIAFDRLIQEGKATGSVDVFTCVKSLREQRRIPQELRTQGISVVLTFEQYIFLYKVLQSWFEQELKSKRCPVVHLQTVDSGYIHMGEQSEPDSTVKLFSLLDSLEES